MIGGTATDNHVEGSSGVQQAGRDIHGISPAEHRSIIEFLLADKLRELADQRALLERVHAAELKSAQAEITLLTSEVATLRAKLANPEAAFAEDSARAADLSARLDREANHLGFEKIDAAKAALARLDYSKAEALFEEIRAADELAVIRMSRAEYGLGEIAEARVDWHKAAAHYARAAELHADLDTLRKAADFRGRTGDYKNAIEIARRYLDLANDTGRPERIASATNDFANILRLRGKLKEAERHYRKAVLLDSNNGPKVSAPQATRLQNLASILCDLGRYDEAKTLFRKAIQIDEVCLGSDHPDYAMAINNFGLLHFETGDFSAAENLIRQALCIDEKSIGTSHPHYAAHLNNLALVLDSTNRSFEAEIHFRKAIQIGQMALGSLHPEPAVWINNLAALFCKAARFTEAESLTSAALGVFSDLLPDAHPYVEGSRQQLSMIRAALSKSSRASSFGTRRDPQK